MAKNDHYKPMVEIAEEIIKKNGKQNLKSLMNSVAEIKGFSQDDAEKSVLLYLDMTLSSKFVYCGNDMWDLKDNNLELWDKDGSYFAKEDEVDYDEEDDEEEIIVDEYYSVVDEDDVVHAEDDEEEDVEKDEEEEAGKLLDDDIPLYSTDDDDPKKPDFDDEDYHDIMDDYEDMYDK